MNLSMTPDQLALADLFGKIFRTESTPARIRAAEPLGWDEQAVGHSDLGGRANDGLGGVAWRWRRVQKRPSGCRRRARTSPCIGATR